MDPNDPLQPAVQRLHQRDYAKAAELFETAYVDGADPILSLGGRIECLYYLQRYDEVLALCDLLAEKCPNASPAHYFRGLVYHRRGRSQEAAEELRLAARHGSVVALAKLKVLGVTP